MSLIVPKKFPKLREKLLRDIARILRYHNLKPNSIDECIAEMLLETQATCQYADWLRNEWGQGTTHGTLYITYQRKPIWQKALDKLNALPDSHPRKMAYHHDKVQKLADFFGLNYSKPL